MQKHTTRPAGLRGRYLYAIVSDSGKSSYGKLGINGGNVYTISDGGVAAVVSDFADQKIRPERRHFAAHQVVLRTLMGECDVLPMSFGIISKSPNAVRRILARNRDAIVSQLERVAGKVEMGLRVAWDVPNIFEYMVSIHPELTRARDHLLSLQRPPTQDEKIEIGRLFEELLESDRDKHTKRVEKSLSRRCSELKRNNCRDEREIMNLACLVSRTAQADFEAGVLEAACHFDDNYTFDYNGPWAPHNFVELAVDI